MNGTAFLLGKVSLFLIASLCPIGLVPALARDLPAFPGAEGFGAYSQGGRGGRVLHVTTLDDSGVGSLRWAIEQDGPRTVVFDVSGTIGLRRELTISEPKLTIAGQTAPGDGICLRDASLVIAADDVVVRYLRCRLGDEGRGGDALSISRGRDILVDHCSASWSTDEVLSASTHRPSLSNVTVQWCFITEALNPKGHGFGSLIRGTGGARYSFHHNLYAHNQGRNPRPGNYDSNPHDEDPEGLLLDFRNNAIYNWGGRHAGYNADRVSVTSLNYVGNYLVPGRNSTQNGVAYSTGSPFNRAYFADNFYQGQSPADPWDLVHFKDDWSDSEIQAYKQSRPFPTLATHQQSAVSAFQKVLQSGGATLPRRDNVDTRIVDQVRNLTGRIINSQSEVGGWPTLSSTAAPQDTDRDGMPDSWEQQHGLAANDASDSSQDQDDDGYTNLEEYLNQTDPTKFVEYRVTED